MSLIDVFRVIEIDSSEVIETIDNDGNIALCYDLDNRGNFFVPLFISKDLDRDMYSTVGCNGGLIDIQLPCNVELLDKPAIDAYAATVDCVLVKYDDKVGIIVANKGMLTYE
jgi:hypothetical protein